MPRKPKRKPYRVIGAYDSETTNIFEDGEYMAFPILHQLGLLDDTPITDITSSNVEQHVSISLYRHAVDLHARLDEIANTDYGYIPVIMCHNLSFDMYGLASWLMAHDAKVLAKSPRKPITFTILDDDDDGNPRLVIWDTLIFSQQPLSRMGKDCGYVKAVGDWDYDLIRTPNTVLTDGEIDYARRDVYALVAWLGWWLRRNPDIKPDKLGFNVVTKTGVVRERRKSRYMGLKGNGCKRKVGWYWLSQCMREAPTTDDELFTMFAATRGGFTFCASKSASVPYDYTGTRMMVVGYDATSQHPAQMVSHLVPVRFTPISGAALTMAFQVIANTSVDDVLAHWDKPFPTAFHGRFRFTRLRPKNGTLWHECGIYPLASARYIDDDNQGDKRNLENSKSFADYKDMLQGGRHAFGKVISADVAELYLTELASWEVSQCYEWDSVEGIEGYETGQFAKPTDMDIISVMQFYKAKNEYKHAREMWRDGKLIDNADMLKSLGIPDAIIDGMIDNTISANDVDATYLSLKADLNALFGINCSNQYLRDTVLGDDGIAYEGDFGLCNAPRKPSVWYQYGQRIVGWSRIAQNIVMQLAYPYCETIINGDTDSVKFAADERNVKLIDAALSRYAVAVDGSKSKVCARVRRAYPDKYDSLEGIGHYVNEFAVKQYCASWNKAYCMRDFDKRENRQRYSFTLAGIPTKRRVSDTSCFVGVDGYADMLHALGMTFEEVCNVMLGYNVVYSNDLVRMNARTFPDWDSSYFGYVVDYKGDKSLVAEPMALSLHPMSKTINDTTDSDNDTNMRYAVANNPHVNTHHVMLTAGGIIDMEGLTI